MLPGDTLRTAARGRPPLLCSAVCGTLGRCERRHTRAIYVSHQRAEHFNSTLILNHTLSLICLLFRCIQDPELVVNVSKTMSLEFIPPAISEDCLYLNVYTPAEATKGNKLPVSKSGRVQGYRVS